MKNAVVALVALLFATAGAFAQGTPIQGTAQLELNAPAQVSSGASIQVGLVVDLSSVTGQGSSGRVPAVLGGYQITVTFDKTKVQLVSVTGGTTPEFAGAPTTTDIAAANSNGSVALTAANTQSSSPTGAVSVARLNFTATGGGTALFGASASSVSSAFQLGAPNSPASIPASNASTNVKIGSGPDAPTLLTPTDGATGVNAPVTLTWSAVSGADQYAVYFGTSFNPPQVTTTTATSYVAATNDGTTYFWRVVAINAFGQSPSTVFSFTTSGNAPCATPGQVSASTSRAEVSSNENYTISWNGVTNATEYKVEESTASNFAGASVTTTALTTATFKHQVTSDTRYYYRVTARNGGACDLSGAASATISVNVKATVVQPTTNEAIIPVVGSVPGSGGSFFKTSVQLFNPTNTIESGRIIFRKQGVAGSANDPSLDYTIQPGATISWDDLLPAMGQNGVLGSADVITTSGALPVALIRIFNDGGALGTSGMTEPLLAKSAALQSGESAHIVTPIDPVATRLNIGVRSLSAGAALEITLRNSAGAIKRTTTRTYAADFFEQITAAAFLGADVAANDTITVKVTSGSAIVYGAATDNKTQDPALQIAQK